MSRKSSIENSRRSTFLSLPREIRDIIYSYLFSGTMALRESIGCPWCPAAGSKNSRPPPLLVASDVPMSDILLCEGCIRLMHYTMDCHHEQMYDPKQRHRYGINHTCPTPHPVPISILRACRQTLFEASGALQGKTMIHRRRNLYENPPLPKRFYFVTVVYTQFYLRNSSYGSAEKVCPPLDVSLVKTRFPMLQEMVIAVIFEPYSQVWPRNPIWDRHFVTALVTYKTNAPFKVKVIAQCLSTEGRESTKKQQVMVANEKARRLVRFFEAELK